MREFLDTLLAADISGTNRKIEKSSGQQGLAAVDDFRASGPPQKTETGDRQSPQETKRRTRGQATILVVEDREMDREMLTTLLEHAGYRVLEVADGPQALELTRAQHPDLVISDVLLPKMDGYQLVQQLRADPAISGTNVIFYTAVFNESEAWNLAREIGVVRILCKPMEPEKILVAVAEVLKGQGAPEAPAPAPSFDEKHLQLLVDKLIGQVKALQGSEERLQRKSQILQGINCVFHEALTCETEAELAHASLEVAKGLTGGTAALMGMVNPAGRLDVTYCDWADCPQLESVQKRGCTEGVRPLHGFFEKIIGEGRSLMVNNLGSALHRDAADCPPSASFLGAPLKNAGQTIGLIALRNKKGGFEPADQDALENLSSPIVEALMRNRSEAALKQAREQLEWRVHERTAELKRAVDQLQQEVEMRQQAEEELHVINEELEQRVQERTAELEVSNKELESFSYTVAHDLKTPIRAIEGFSRMLMGDHAGQLDAEGLRLLQVVCDNTKIMHQLVNDLLSLARLVRQPMRKSRIDLGGMAGQVFGRLKSQAPGRSLELIIKELPPAQGDHSLLYQVLNNLLDNAIKYSRSKESAVIEVGGWTAAQEIVCYVKDNGIGFDEHYVDKIFSPFQRLHGLEEYEGTGIGLANVQRIIERHGGRVWAEGKVDEGATFYFTLPRDHDNTNSGV